MKNEQVKNWDKWIESLEGQKCREGRTDGQYLQNRLWRAFMAGYEAAKNVKQ